MPTLKTASPPRQTNPLVYFSVMAISYVLLIFILPANALTMQQYHLSPAQYHLSLLAVTAPSLLVWGIAFAGYAKLQRYARSLQGTPDGRDFNYLATGCAWLAWSLAVPSLVSILANAIAGSHPGFHPTAIISVNYLSLLMPLIGYSILSTGSRNLLQSAKLHLSLAHSRLLGVIFVIIGVLFCYLTFLHFDHDSLSSNHNPYFLPGWLLVVSLIVPYLYAWFIGLLSAQELSVFSANSQGLLYRRALRLLSLGLIIVIASSIALEYLGSVVPRTGHLVFDKHLLFISLVRVISGLGYLLIANGAGRLLKIEEA